VIEAARPATADDRAAVGALHRAATDELAGLRGGEVWARQTRRDAGPAWPDDGLVLVGTIDEVVVGYAIVAVEPLADGGALAVLSDVYVEPEARGVGVGESLLDACLAWASERGCIGVDSVALPGMRDTKNFFEAAGLVARAIVVHKRLP
jgi:GNAT superfamily N-acetyltransferase